MSSAPPPHPEVAKYFSDPAANVVFKTSDGVILRVEDFFLKAGSAVFRDMLSSSTPSSSEENPLPIDEDSSVFITAMLVITGHLQEALHRPKDWVQAKDLYLVMQKYQLDILHPWFSEICSVWAAEKPFEALILACDQPYIDTTLARTAICEGMAKGTPGQLFDPRYFLTDPTRGIYPNPAEHIYKLKLDMINPRNTTIAFGIQLGFKGFLAYNATFSNASSSNPLSWHELSNTFVKTARQVERDMLNE